MAVLDKVFGKNWREEKREYRELQARVKALPADYEKTYKAIQSYCYNTGLINNDWQRFTDLLDLFEVSAADGFPVKNIVGGDVAEFCDVFFDKEGGNVGWLDKQRQALNDYFAKR
jgi:DNA-binding ferritin-like protein (Dps family)